MSHNSSGSKKAIHDPSEIKKILKFLDYIPEKYKTGPWSIAVHLYIFACVAILIYIYPAALQYKSIESYSEQNDNVQSFRLITGLYGAALSIFLVIFAGLWPFSSYTLTSWNLMVARCLSAYLAARTPDAENSVAKVVAAATKFPALAGCTITVVVWWGVLTPLIAYLLRSKEKREESRQFWRWNTSFFLLNVHLGNLAVAAGEFILSERLLTLHDLWMGFAVALVYVLFYLNVLDPLGLHFYIILTPRTWLTVFTYSLILGLYYLVFIGWNAALV